MIQWHIHVFNCRHATLSYALSVCPSVFQFVCGSTMVMKLKIEKRRIFEAPDVSVCVRVCVGWVRVWMGIVRPCPVVCNNLVTLYCLLFLDPSFNLSATIFLSDCLAVFMFCRQSIFCQSVCLAYRYSGDLSCQIFVCTGYCTPPSTLFNYYLNHQNLLILNSETLKHQ